MFTRFSRYRNGQDHDEVGWRNALHSENPEDIQWSTGDRPQGDPVLTVELEHDENETGVSLAVLELQSRIQDYRGIDLPPLESASVEVEEIRASASVRRVRRVDYPTLVVTGPHNRATIPQILELLERMKTEYENRLVDKRYRP